MTVYHVYLVSTAIVEVETDSPEKAEALAVGNTPSWVFGENFSVADVKVAQRPHHTVWVREDA